MSNKQEIAEKLKASGIDFDCDNLCFGNESNQSLRWAPYPSADQSEAILAAMGLQVGKDGFSWTIVGVSSYADFTMEELKTQNEIFEGIKPHERTLANNVALAWLCDNKADELKTAIEEVRG